MSNKPKTRAEEIAYDVGVKDGRHGQDKCPYITEPFAQYWRDGHARGNAETESGGASTEWNQMQRRAKQKAGAVLSVCWMVFLNRRAVWASHSGPGTVRRLGTDSAAHIEEAKTRAMQAGVDFDSIRIRFYKSNAGNDTSAT